jgi:hypothetical protein
MLMGMRVRGAAGRILDLSESGTTLAMLCVDLGAPLAYCRRKECIGIGGWLSEAAGRTSTACLTRKYAFLGCLQGCETITPQPHFTYI